MRTEKYKEMTTKIAWRPLIIGFSVATLLFGVLVLAFYLGGVNEKRFSQSTRAIPVWASASCESNGSALSTGYFNDGVEALYYLDSQNARLSAAILSRNEPNFIKTYTRNIRIDLTEAVSKLNLTLPANPQFIMVSGDADIRQFGAGEMNKLSKSILYVAEINSGIVMVYALPNYGDRDLEITEGEIRFWTFARLNSGINGTSTVINNQQPPQQKSNAIDAGFFNR